MSGEASPREHWRGSCPPLGPSPRDKYLTSSVRTWPASPCSPWASFCKCSPPLPTLRLQLLGVQHQVGVPKTPGPSHPEPPWVAEQRLWDVETCFQHTSNPPLYQEDLPPETKPGDTEQSVSRLVGLMGVGPAGTPVTELGLRAMQSLVTREHWDLLVSPGEGDPSVPMEW